MILADVNPLAAGPNPLLSRWPRLSNAAGAAAEYRVTGGETCAARTPSCQAIRSGCFPDQCRGRRTRLCDCRDPGRRGPVAQPLMLLSDKPTVASRAPLPGRCGALSVLPNDCNQWNRPGSINGLYERGRTARDSRRRVGKRRKPASCTERKESSICR